MDVAVTQQGNAGPEGLGASGPNNDYADKLMLFGQFVGDWEVDFEVYSSDGSKQIEKAEWHFGWVLEGRAIQDVFIIPRRVDREESDWARKDYGTCLRFSPFASPNVCQAKLTGSRKNLVKKPPPTMKFLGA